MKGKARSISTEAEVGTEWRGVEAPPEPYDFVSLRFEDGIVRRGTWTGKLWWGYDERAHRSHEFHPVAWRLLD